ncbi:CsbD family protein [Sphingomonas koreensis]|nr:CsbD family protein [Sphingomonas koreensis]
MTSDRIEGAAKEAKGFVKEALGKVTGNKKAQAKGAIEKKDAEVQAAAGKARNALGDAVRQRRHMKRVQDRNFNRGRRV